MSWFYLDLTFAVVTLNLKMLFGLYLRKLQGVGSSYLLGTLVRGCR